MVASGWMGAGAPRSRPSIPMAWVGTRAAKAASLQQMHWPGRPRKGSAGRPRLQERQGTRDRYDTVAGPTIGAVNVFLRIYQHCNGNHRPRVLLDKPAHTGVGERLVEA